jgi:hypothetical protein
MRSRRRPDSLSQKTLYLTALASFRLLSAFCATRTNAERRRPKTTKPRDGGACGATAAANRAANFA